MSKTLLVLAASTYQLSVIATAKRLGLRVVTTDNAPSNPGHRLADASYHVDTTDFQGVLKIARQERIDGVISPATDVSVATAAFIAEQLCLPGPSLLAAQTLTSKLSFRKFLSEAGLPYPKAFRISSSSRPNPAVFGRSRWIIKPNQSSGSKGVFILESGADFDRCFEESLAFSADGCAILEEYLTGAHHTCEGILRNGRIALALTTDRDTALPPHTATIGHRVPCTLSSAAQANIKTMQETIFKRLGVRDGPFDCDFVADGDRVAIIEMTPRLGGNSLSALFCAAYEFDLVEYAVKQACGVAGELPPQTSPKPSAILILGVGRSGSLKMDRAAVDALRREPWVRSLILDYPEGHPVMPFINGRHRVGEALITGKDRSDIDYKSDLLRTKLGLTAA
ncbi:MAG: ATP-grasp domain-containing protein [Gammaproteobacteria bacterium]